MLASVTVALCVLGPSSASALDNGHAFSHEIKPTGAAAFTGIEYCCSEIYPPYLTDLAVDNSSGPSAGDIYVIDYNGHRVEKFDSEGNFLLMFGHGVNQTTEGDVCTAASGDTCRVGTETSSAAGFQCPNYVVVDGSSGPSAGDVYVGDVCQQKIHKYGEGGNLITGWGNEGVLSRSEATFGSILGITVTGTGQLLVRGCQECFGEEDRATLIRYGQDGALQSVATTPSQEFREGLALSPDESSVYYGGSGASNYAVFRASAADGSGAVEFSPGTYEPPYNGFRAIANGLAVDGAGTVYAAMDNYESGSGKIWEWQVNGAGQPLDAKGHPCAVTLSAGQPGCPPTHEFGANVLSEAPHGPAVDESTGTIYATNSAASAVDAFVAAPEGIADTEGVTWVATAHGVAEPDGAGNIVSCEFQYGPTTKYGSSEECSAAGPLPYTTATPVSAELPGLNGDGQHTYHDRLVIENAAGAVSFGSDHAFVPTDVKGLQTRPAENVTRTEATLKGEYEDTGLKTEYFFEWGTSECPCPNQSPKTEATSTGLSALADADEALAHLKPQTVYHYRVVAENELGTTYGAEQTLETEPAVKTLTTEGAEPVERRKATVKGSFQGDGTPTTYSFEWGETASYGNTLETQDAGSPSGAQQVAMEIDGCPEGEPDPKGCLVPSYSNAAAPGPQVYHYRITATDELGTTVGGDREFTTLPAVASLETEPATGIGQEQITLNGKFAGNGEDTQYYFEYGLTPAYGKQTEIADAGDASDPTEVSSVITDFEAYETYHYRVVAKNAYGTTYGNDQTFEAEASPLPEISDTRSSGIVPTAATLEAMVNPNRRQTVFAFEYGRTAEYGESTEISQSIGSDKAFHQVDERITGLQPGASYHFRVVAISFSGTRYGPDEVLTTPDVPAVELSEVGSVGETTAHLGAAVKPNGSATTVSFEYGSSIAYGRSAGPLSIAAVSGEQQVGVDLSGLEPETTYHFRAVATNAFGSTSGPDQTFTTKPTPKTGPPPNVKCRKGFVKRHGKCVKKPNRHHRRHHKKQRRGGAR